MPENENTAQEPEQPEAAAEPVAKEVSEEQPEQLPEHELICGECGAHYSKGDIACPNVSNHGKP